MNHNLNLLLKSVYLSFEVRETNVLEKYVVAFLIFDKIDISRQWLRVTGNCLANEEKTASSMVVGQQQHPIGL